MKVGRRNQLPGRLACACNIEAEIGDTALKIECRGLKQGLSDICLRNRHIALDTGNRAPIELSGHFESTVEHFAGNFGDRQEPVFQRRPDGRAVHRELPVKQRLCADRQIRIDQPERRRVKRLAGKTAGRGTVLSTRRSRRPGNARRYR